MEKSKYLPVSPRRFCRQLTDIKDSHRLITDRFALPAGANRNACNVEDRTWCGGTWSTYVLSCETCNESKWLISILCSIRENLDYIQNAGFTASECVYPVLLPRPHHLLSKSGSLLSIRTTKDRVPIGEMRTTAIGLLMPRS